MSASFLRASLFSSIVSFGVAAMAMGLSVVLLLIGVALRSIAGAPAAMTRPAQPDVHDRCRSPWCEEPDRACP